MTSLRRNAKAEDVANLVEFLVSEKASFISGETIRLFPDSIPALQQLAKHGFPLS